MNRFLLLLTILLVLCSTGGAIRRESDWGSPQIQKLTRSAYHDFVLTGRFAEAQSRYEEALRIATAGHYRRAMTRILMNLANSDIVFQRYRAAASRYRQALDLAGQTGDCESMATSHSNLAAIYVPLFDIPSAAFHAERAVALRSCLTKTRAEAGLQLGWVRSLQERHAESVTLLRRGIDEIDRAQGPGTDARLSLAWNYLAEQLRSMGQLTEADDFLSKAYAFQRLNRDPSLFFTRFHLARLRLAQGDAASARHLIDAAIATAPPGRMPEYMFLHLRGRVLEAQNDLAGAVEEYRKALRAAARWRGRILPADSYRTSANAGLQEIYDSFIEAAVRLSKIQGSSALLQEAWQASETNRAASLRENLLGSSDWRQKLDPEYWEVLARLRASESQALLRGVSAKSKGDDDLRVRLTELETRAGLISLSNFNHFLENNSLDISLSLVRRVLGNSRTLMSFHLGDTGSFRWTVTSDSITVAPLPSVPVIKESVEKFRTALESEDPHAAALGNDVYRMLFGDVAATVPRNWLLALEAPLFRVPLAALATGYSNSHPNYLIEQGTLEVVPGAWAIGDGTARFTGLFLGVGDAIYNRADPRLAGVRQVPQTSDAILASRGPTYELPRLIGSGREVESCARLWKGGSRIVSGAGVTRTRFVEALSERPAVIHIAAHFVPSKQAEEQTLVAFSLNPDTYRLDLMTAPDVATLSIPGSLVVLSGCSSAAGRQLPGAGLLGLTRAFLSAGATAVIASHWPTPDDSGEMFARFYLHLSEGQTTSPANALRQAQLDMLHSSGWRAAPRYWAAFQLYGRSNRLL